MSWFDRVLGVAPPGSPAADGGEQLPLLQGREASYAEVLQSSQQQPVETEVVRESSLSSKSSHHRSVDVTASTDSKQQDELRLSIKQPLGQLQQQAGAAVAPPLQQKQQQQQQQPSSSSSAVKATLFGLTNLSSVVAIVFANKLVLYTHGFHFAATLTWLHTIFTTIGMIAMAAVGFFEIKRVPVSKSLPVATVYVGFIVLNNLSIQLNTVGFYQISKIAITPVVVAIEWAFYSKPASPRILASIAVLLTGITLATVTDSQVSSRPLGMLVAAINVCVTGLYQVWAGSKQRELGLNGLQLLHQVAPLSVALLAVIIPLLEPVGFTNPGPDTVLGYTLTPGAAFWIIVSSMLGLVVTLSTFLFIGATSSLTYNVVGHMKTVLIVAGGVLLFGDSMSAKKLAGLGCAMAGIVWYSQIKLGEASKAGKQ
uniref:Sugar phosphate transporter domain-containing protein n=1 Tax=Tetradesmus obliquus TaxID=3088 RepID=A0A383VFD1_TETOB|eukprot:jgi/Sobl393_1/17456/SZX64268.1